MSRTINVGYDAFEGQSFEPIPAGTLLPVIITDIEEVAVKSGPNEGKPQLRLTVTAFEGKYKGRKIMYENIPLYASKAAWKLVTFASAAGIKTDPETGNIELPDSLGELLGTKVTVKVGVREPDNQGRVFNSVAQYRKYQPASGVTASSESKISSWDQLNS